MKIKALLLIPLLLATLACPSSPYGKAVKAGLDITDTIHTGADTVNQLRLAGTVTPEEEKAILGYLATINHLDVDVYGPCVQSAHASGGATSGFLACAQSFAASADDPTLLSSLRITNLASQQRVQGIAVAIQNLLTTVITALGKGK